MGYFFKCICGLIRFGLNTAWSSVSPLIKFRLLSLFIGMTKTPMMRVQNLNIITLRTGLYCLLFGNACFAWTFSFCFFTIKLQQRICLKTLHNDEKWFYKFIFVFFTNIFLIFTSFFGFRDLLIHRRYFFFVFLLKCNASFFLFK